jgi:hypothetical protein
MKFADSNEAQVWVTFATASLNSNRNFFTDNSHIPFKVEEIADYLLNEYRKRLRE